MSYDNTNRGQFWRNERKEKDTHPDFTGSINVEGVEYWLSAWSRKPGANPKSPAVSISIKRKDDTQISNPSTAGVPAHDDDIPF